MERFTVKAPTRVDLAGGTLDIWPLYCLTGHAKTVNIAIDLCAEADFEVVNAERFEVEIVNQQGNAFHFRELITMEQALRLEPSFRFPAAIVSRFFSQFEELPNQKLRISLRSSAPPRSGLGGSSTLCVVLARGLARVFNSYMEQGWQWRLLTWVRDTEAMFLKVPTGTQDYLAALFGGASCYAYGGGRIQQIPYPDSVYQGIAERLLVLFSGEMHDSGLSNWEIFKRAIEGDAETIRGLEAIRDIADNLDEELQSGNLGWSHIGRHLNEDWRIRKHLFGVHTKRLDEILAFLAEQKVYGAKVCGAAQGGSLIALVEPSHLPKVAEACEKHGIHVLKTHATRDGATIKPL